MADKRAQKLIALVQETIPGPVACAGIFLIDRRSGQRRLRHAPIA